MIIQQALHGNGNEQNKREYQIYTSTKIKSAQQCSRVYYSGVIWQFI